MIDWEEIACTENADELKEAKLWLFRENIRLENERRELDELNRRTEQERKRLKEENLFFEKKMAILQNGFRQLDQDRQALERQKKAMMEDGSRIRQIAETPSSEYAAKRLFAGINNSLALRKRYRDLVKIFHPDNLFGDEELAQLINKEYLRRKEEL